VVSHFAGPLRSRQDWRVGDLVVPWDNRCALHRRDPFDPNSRREMPHRTRLKGDSDSDSR